MYLFAIESIPAPVCFKSSRISSSNICLQKEIKFDSLYILIFIPLVHEVHHNDHVNPTHK